MECRNFKSLRKKLGSTAGESLVEVLVSLLIAALAILLLGQSVSASVNMIRNSGKAMEDYYAAANVLAERPSGSVMSGEATVSVICTWEGEIMPDYPAAEYAVGYYVNQEDGSHKVVSYGLTE